jgi:hypothetical protein
VPLAWRALTPDGIKVHGFAYSNRVNSHDPRRDRDTNCSVWVTTAESFLTTEETRAAAIARCRAEIAQMIAIQTTGREDERLGALQGEMDWRAELHHWEKEEQA